VDVAAFQRLSLGPDGQRLMADGKKGPRTSWALALEEMPRWRFNLVLAALKWVGFRETGENGGPEVTSWLGACGVGPGNPWCAAFLSALLRGVGIECAEARVSELARKFPDVEAPLPGDIAYWLRDDGTGHCGIVTGVDGDRVAVCEGNSGDAVRVGWRPFAGLRFCCPRGEGMPAVWDGLTQLGSKTR
jgi:hypothetical protein